MSKEEEGKESNEEEEIMIILFSVPKTAIALYPRILFRFLHIN
jgi:hypothetical protein